jgi:hypothetical protein
MLLWHMAAAAVAVGGGAGLVADWPFAVGDTVATVSAWALVGGAAALGLIALAELTSKHATRNISDAVHHLTRGAFARRWWLGGVALGVAVPMVLGTLALRDVSVLGGIGGLAAMAGIWFSDDAFVKAGQSVPLS